MHQPTLSGIVKRRFLHCVHHRQHAVHDVVRAINIPPGHLCQIIADQNVPELPLITFFQVARWLKMPLANVMVLGKRTPKIEELVRLGMVVRGMRPSNTRAQERAAAQACISVAVFRRALHGYSTFTPSMLTCQRLATWLSWAGLDLETIAHSAGMAVRYTASGACMVISPSMLKYIKPYPCACGRVGCMVPAHIPNGPRRKWRSDACRMWVKRRNERERKASSALQPTVTRLPHHNQIMRFITINERVVPVRF